MIRLLTLSAITLVLAACGGSSDVSDDTHGISTDKNAATGFMTENPVPPANAKPCNKEGIDLLCDADGRPHGYNFLGKKLPDFGGEMVSGRSFDSAMIDRWTIIDVWGIWCGDCIADAPYVAALASQTRTDPALAFLSIHVPASEGRATPEEMYGKFGSIDAYFKDKGYSYPTIIDTDASLRDTLQIAWTPTYLLVSPDGIVRGFRTDLSVAGGEPVKDFLADVEKVRTDMRKERFGVAVPAPTIGSDGAVSLTSETVFTVAALENAFPGYDILVDRKMTEGEEYPVYLVRVPAGLESAGNLVFVVEPSWTKGHVQTVLTRSRAVEGPQGLRILQTMLKDLPDDLRALCVRGENEYNEFLMCPDQPSDPRFIAVFGAGPDFDGKFFDADEEYQGWGQLVEMRFLPPVPTDAK